MIPFALALQLLASGQTMVTYEDVPVQVVRVVVLEWPAMRVIGVSASSGTTTLTARGTPHRSYVVTLARADEEYLIDGPFAWPAVDSRRTMAVRWHRTIKGAVPPGAEGPKDVQWIPADSAPGPWPMCGPDGAATWACWGMLPESRGVVVVSAASEIFWTVPAAQSGTVLRRTRWGRLLVVHDQARQDAVLRVTFGRPVTPAAARLRGIRLETAAVAGARAVPIAPRIMWLAGDAVPPKAWVDIRSESSGPAYLALQDVAEGSPAVPLHVTLAERRIVQGRVIGASGAAAPGTLITVFRMIDPPPSTGSRVQPRRVLAGEMTADDQGAFVIDSVGDAEYEVVAWHSQLGRAAVPVTAAGSDLVIHLRSSGIARGRVLVRGGPAPDVAVVSVPDAAVFSAAEDITDVKGGDAMTGADGRFSVTLAPSGGGELRIGGGALPVRRVPLPRGPVASLEIGDIELGSPIDLTVVLEGDPGCGVRAAGPVGRTGLQIVSGVRRADGTHRLTLPETGLWEFSLVCAGAARSLLPGTVEITAANAGKEMRFTVR